MVGFAIALPTLQNTLIFQLLKYLCLTMRVLPGVGEIIFLNIYRNTKYLYNLIEKKHSRPPTIKDRLLKSTSLCLYHEETDIIYIYL